ncbi:response regulator transcription factor [Gammaproteobacteria bacterium]|jgi:DNA-binding response OmpR family regulator|nr:response regulator transcription factor [Gammaproteobacteria bacterium]
MFRALLIDDDVKLGRLLKDFLKKSNINLFTVNNPTESFSSIEECKPDIIILDVMMPKMDGFEVCKNIRKVHSIPIIMLSARGDSEDKIKGLDLGADDYIAKPFQPRELLARIHSLLRRVSDEKKISIKGFFEVDELHREIKMKGELLQLTNKEYELLSLLVFNPGVIYTRDDLLREIKGVEAKLFSRSIDILISRLRNKIEKNNESPEYIKTIWGKGYIFTNSHKLDS